jgi:hypothetical protein
MSEEWFVAVDGRTASGPFTADEIRARLAAGTMASHMHAFRRDDAGRRPLSDQEEFFPNQAIAATLASATTGLGPGGQPVGARTGLPEWARVLGYTALVMAVVLSLIGIVALATRGDEPRKTAQSAAETTSSTPSPRKKPARKPLPPPKTPLERILEIDTFLSAVAYAKPSMADSVEMVDEGTLLIFAWAQKRLRWGDVNVARNETSPALVRKDPDAERGKRACVRGTIVEIKVFRLDFGRGYEGLLMTNDVQFVKFGAVGSTGTLVADSPARFCGVVTGEHAFANVSGGQTRTVLMVGMFDLPENRER